MKSLKNLKSWKYKKLLKNNRYNFKRGYVLKHLPSSLITNAFKSISSWKNYKATPLLSLDKLKKVQEPSYFFKLSKWQKPLLDFYKKNKNFVKPASRFNEVKSFVENGLEDLSISRTSFKWGIKVPKNCLLYTSPSPRDVP